MARAHALYSDLRTMYLDGKTPEACRLTLPVDKSDHSYLEADSTPFINSTKAEINVNKALATELNDEGARRVQRFLGLNIRDSFSNSTPDRSGLSEMEVDFDRPKQLSWEYSTFCSWQDASQRRAREASGSITASQPDGDVLGSGRKDGNDCDWISWIAIFTSGDNHTPRQTDA